MDSRQILTGEGDSISQQTTGQRYSRPNTLGELLSASSPNQTGLLKLLAVANHNGMPLGPILRSYANEVRGSHGYRLKDLAKAVDAGVDPIEALEKIDKLLTPSTIFALRLARDDRSLPHFYQSVIEYSSEFQRDTMNPGEGVQKAISLWVRFHFVMAIVGFLMLYIVPEFHKMFEEFGIELPGAMRELIGYADIAAKFWFLWVLILLPIFYWLGSSVIRQLSPANWRRRRESKAMHQRRALALAVESRPPEAVLPTIYACAPVMKFFKRLINANARIENGQEQWSSMAEESMITKHEASTISASASRDTKAWLLRWSARKGRQRSDSIQRWLMTIMFAVGNIALALLVFLTVYAVFATLIKIMNGIV